MTRIIFGVVIFFTLASSNQPTSAAVVYDSLAKWGGGYGVRDSEAGQTIQLSGSARQVTRIELSLGANSNAEFRVRLYRLDGMGGTPGTLFWESPTQVFTWDPPYYNRKFVAIDVPGHHGPGSICLGSKRIRLGRISGCPKFTTANHRFTF